MRIRYGKPIKVKSLFNYHSLTAYFQNLFTGGAKAWGDNLFTNTGNKDYLYSIFEPNKKYYVWIKATCVEYNGEGKEEASNFANIFWFSNMFTTNNPLSAHYLKYTGDTWEQSFQIQTKADPDFSNATFWYFYTNRYTDGTLNKVKFDMVILEIDESQGLTKEYYDNHKTNFSLIATGEEITIDDKSGQVSLGTRLPVEYQEVEYIESPNTQYIDTGKTVDSTCIISFDFQYVSIISGYNRIFGARNSNGNGLLNIRSTDSDGGNFYLENRNTAWSDTPVDTNRHSIVMNSVTNKMTFDGVEKLSNFGIDDNTEGTMWIFGTNQGGSTSNVRFFNYKLIKNGQLEQNLIPCYRKSDNVIGMYDLVEKQFYTNQGTETFLKGKNINTISCKVAGGSSDVYYGYNQRVIPNDNTTHNGNAYSYDSDTNTFTLTANASTTTYYFGLSCTKLTGMTGHKVLFIGNVTEVSTVAPFTDITGEWAMTNVTDRQRATGVGLTYCIGEWRNVTSNYINITTSTNFTVGDYFKIKDVQIIDLTDWFGAGKEPNTYEEFKEKFIKEYYGPCATPIKLTQYQIEALPNYGYNQLVQPITYYTTSSGFSWAHDNNILTLSGSAITSTYVNPFYAQPIIAEHKYLAYANILSNSKNVSFQFGMLNDSVRISDIILGEYWTIMSAAANRSTSIGLAQFVNGSDIGVIVGRFLMIDLTNWYGEGNEPTTIEEFKATFPNSYYPYSQKRLLNKYMINKLQA